MINHHDNGKFIFILLTGFPLLLMLMKADLNQYSGLIPNSISGWGAVDEGQIYNARTIYDYMDGAAEVYKEYSFLELYVRRYKKPGQPVITLEIFNMDKSQDAFGIFSHIRSGEEIEIGQGSDDGNGTITFWKDRYFVYLTSEDETDETASALMQFAKAISGKIPTTGEAPKILQLLPQQDLIKAQVRYLRSYILLNMHYFIATENILNIDHNTEVVLAPYSNGEDEHYVILLRYPDEDTASKAASSFLSNYFPGSKGSNIGKNEFGDWVGISQTGKYLNIVFEAQSMELTLNILEHISNN